MLPKKVKNHDQDDSEKKELLNEQMLNQMILTKLILLQN